MGKVLPDEDDFEEPSEELGDEEELVGTGDTDDLVLAEIGDGPEEIGLDAESGAEERGEGTLLDLFDAEEDEGARWALDDALAEVDEDFDVAGEEHGWTEDSEGLGGTWDDEIGLDEEGEHLDDGGLEGVDDPMLAELELDEGEGTVTSDDEENDPDDGEEEGEGEWGDELSPGLARAWDSAPSTSHSRAGSRASTAWPLMA